MQPSPRQVHLDFHTSEHIPGVGERFDPAAFARMAKEAYVSSMTVFARCHHGWLYYPSERFPELVHPGLANKNLLIEQVDALHEAGIRAPVYITVQWDHHSARTHPEWLIRKSGGAHEGGSFLEPGFYQSLCVNTGYLAFLREQTAEVCRMLGDRLDGLFFDIVGIRPCLCSSCRPLMRERGIDMADEAAVRAFAKETIDRFKQEMTAFVRTFSPDCTIFYNAGHVGPCTYESRDAYTHFELESLPSGSWGYLHFPVTARYARALGKPCVGMTGKFHTEWGDFHSLKNAAALEFECFRMLSYGFASSIGDQLEPFGALNPATYRLIRSVYEPFSRYEEWALPSSPVVEAAVLTPESAMAEHQIPESLFGACQMLEEIALQFDVIDERMPLSPYKLLILPDDFTPSENFHKKLDIFAENGGKILAVGRGGLCAEGSYPDCFRVKYEGDAPLYPDFIVADGPLTQELEPENEYVVYRQGVRAESTGATPVLFARAPYFSREGERFCSHRYTPSAKGEPYPVGFRSGNVLLLTHPLFAQYRVNAPRWCKELIRSAIGELLPDRLIEHDGPSTLSASLLLQPEKNRYALHLLSYIPVRKSASIDIVEERTKALDVTLRLNLPSPILCARLVPDGPELEVREGAVTVPCIDGYAIVEISVDQSET